MIRLLKFILNIAVYAGIVAGIVWGLPEFLSWKLGTEYPIAAITSGSMWPALKRGDLVLIQKVGREDIKVGDIVVWKNPKGFTIHRVVKLSGTTLQTKGDGNFKEDAPVGYSDVVGRTVSRGEKPFRVPYLGYIAFWGGSIREVQTPLEVQPSVL